jgi:hypothetical protein
MTPPGKPLAGRSLAHSGRLRGLLDPPALSLDALDQQPATVRTGTGVTVEPHPVPPWAWVAWQLPASKEARTNNLLRNYT